uniref:BZIP domain-containing protein n=1 Tax=Arion vulgaris TaxID=1028688 RepID=A0A0B7A0Y4_9EUPU
MDHSSLYSDSDGPDSEVRKLKRSMTLDFNASSATKQKKLASVLASPDLNMLKLASPELERMIIQANGLVTTTPTPTQFLFPKFVTEEQDAYAWGFIDALAELQNSGALSANRTQELSRTFTTLTVPTALSQSATVPSTASLPVFSSPNEPSATTSLPGGPAGRGPHNVSPPNTALPTFRATLPVSTAGLDVRIPNVKDEPQTVPCFTTSPPLSPINMESQEKFKLERKRARNRVAARKCRTRKLERISRLEDRVNELKGQNGDLVSTATNLRDQVMKLKKKIVEHVNGGCRIITPMVQSIGF